MVPQILQLVSEPCPEEWPTTVGASHKGCLPRAVKSWISIEHLVFRYEEGDGLRYIRIWATPLKRLVFWYGVLNLSIGSN